MTAARQWPQQPVVFEVNTAVWLGEVAERHGGTVTLADVPTPEWDALVPDGITVVWLMGVWSRSAAGRDIALADPGLRSAWSAALPGWSDADLAGSPYCIRAYEPDGGFGGWPGLDAAREQLRRRGALLMLDWVPNHVAPDSPWLGESPDAFVRGSDADAERDPTAYVRIGDAVFARGKDPYFPPWADVVQVNAFAPSLRDLTVTTLTTIAAHADAVRCDMAMLMLDDVVTSTWGERVGAAPERTYWAEVIGAVRSVAPGFRFVAEAYWDREWDLQQLGFDYCYDKRLYDRLEHDTVAGVSAHLDADPAYQRRLVRFLENHDEPRAAATFAPVEREMAYVVAVATLPGMTLWHEGQAEGRRVFVPVFLSRRVSEPLDADRAGWYHRLWTAAPRVRTGAWSRCAVSGWPDNPSFARLLAWHWVRPDGFTLVVVNLSPEPADGVVNLRAVASAGGPWRLTDVLTATAYERDGADMAAHGMYVSRPGWGWHVLEARPQER
ncbi:MAG: hypothetical protein ACOYBY_13175 [Dermatophilaceae bacterium]